MNDVIILDYIYKKKNTLFKVRHLKWVTWFRSDEPIQINHLKCVTWLRDRSTNPKRSSKLMERQLIHLMFIFPKNRKSKLKSNTLNNKYSPSALKIWNCLKDVLTLKMLKTKRISCSFYFSVKVDILISLLFIILLFSLQLNYFFSYLYVYNN